MTQQTQQTPAHPLGRVDTSDPDHPVGGGSVDVPSIVDTILDLDAFLSGDVRRAERLAQFATKPYLEAEIDALDAQLETLRDPSGRAALADPDEPAAERAVGDAPSTATEEERVAAEIRELQEEYAASFRGVRMRQLTSDDWDAFQLRWRKELESKEPNPPELWDDLIVLCAVAPTITGGQIKTLRAKVGHPQIQMLAQVAWNVNVGSGVSVPKSRLSSDVLRRKGRSKS